MPQRTTTDVINLGQYLEPDFDPTSLTIPLLFGILSYHNVKYPTSCSKRELVKLFNDKIKSRSTELRTERNQNTHELDSEGITDGLTGASLPLQYVICLPSVTMLMPVRPSIVRYVQKLSIPAVCQDRMIK